MKLMRSLNIQQLPVVSLRVVSMPQQSTFARKLSQFLRKALLLFLISLKTRELRGRCPDSVLEFLAEGGESSTAEIISHLAGLNN
jgi:hypothetical protein